jgi:hypothetical protein
MAYRPASLALVLGLGQARDPEDDRPSFARFGDLPLEMKHMIYRYYCNDLDAIYSCEYKYDDQPALLRQSARLRAEALPVFYSHSIFAAEVDTWPPIFHGVPRAHLDDSTEEMLFNLPDATLCRIRHLQLTLDFDMQPLRRFVITFDLTQWNDFDRAIRIGRIVPQKHVHYVDTFGRAIQRTMRLLFDEVPRRQSLHGRPRCDDVLRKAAKLLDDEFVDDDYWIDEAYNESIAAARDFRRRARLGRHQQWLQLLQLQAQNALVLLYVQALLIQIAFS